MTDVGVSFPESGRDAGSIGSRAGSRDSDAEFDRITRAAARLLQTRWASLALHKGGRLVIAAACGQARTPMDLATQVVTETRAMAVGGPELRVDSIPVPELPQARAGAGVPVFDREGTCAGALCVFTEAARNFDDNDFAVLAFAADSVARELELQQTRRRAQQQLDYIEMTEAVANLGHWRLHVPSGTLVWSPQTHRICGLLPENGPPSLEQALHCYHPEDRPKVQRAVQTAMERGQAFEFQHRIVRPSGEVRMVHVRGLAHPDAHGDGAEQLFGVIIDVTDLEQVRARLAQAERMVSLGTLAAGVAHEINNPLSFVATNAEMAAELAACDPRDAELVHMLSDIRDGAERIRQIVRGLKDFSRPPEPRPLAFPLSRALRTAMRLSQNEVRHKATLDANLPEPGPFVRGDETQLVQVAVNLLMNAAQSMADGDAENNRVRVTLGTTDDPEPTAFFRVEDSGSGMTPDVLQKAFGPFFTTKGQHGGTGLGLSLSRGIVADHGGTITAESQVGLGTTLEVRLPRVEGPPHRHPSQPPRARAPDRVRQVLVVDDEPQIAKALARRLRPHRVTACTDARQALERIGDSAHFDLVLCDLMMPSMTGAEFLQALRQMRPDLAQRTVFMSGGAFTPAMREFLAREQPRLFDKPLDVSALLRRIESL
jgi:signal transduction histidine kinase